MGIFNIFYLIFMVDSSSLLSFFSRYHEIYFYYRQILYLNNIQFSSVTQSCLTCFNPTDCSTPGFPVLHYLVEFAQTHVHGVSDAILFCHPCLLLPSVFPGIRVFSNELAFCISWPKYWSFSFSISPSNEYLGLISLRIDWFSVQFSCSVVSDSL